MALAKATITPERPKGAPISVLFNPSNYSFDTSVQLAEVGIPGLGSPVLQYVRGGSRVLSMELFFDSYEQRKDVRTYTNEIFGLLDIEPETHAPAICRFTWGAGKWGKRDDNSFLCVVESVSGRFTLFLEDGTPARATLNVKFREFVDVQVAVRRAPTQSRDHAKTRTVARGDTLSSVAAAEYGDPGAWRPIADVNGIANPRRLEVGTELAIPALDERGTARP
jgi:hypothetical protein